MVKLPGYILSIGMGGLRVALFVVIGALVAWLQSLWGASRDQFILNGIGGGLGAVLALDLWLYWNARRHQSDEHTKR